MLFAELEGHPGASVVLLHAHPDDETLATGGLMARLVADGYRVILLTGTRGERGEVVPGPLQHLEGTPELAAVRVAELAVAMRALGVADHRFLGAAGARAAGLLPRTYSDSGMQWGPEGDAIAADDAPADALSLAPLGEVVADILSVIDETVPRLLVSYDERGGYGHPDHVRMHDAAVEVSERTGAPLYTVVAEWNGDAPADAGDIVVPLAAHREAKFAALAAHATQLTVDGGDIVLSGGQRHTVAGTEVFRLFRSPDPLDSLGATAP
ncbi:MAG: N-acetyl-D-myo-inositol-2-amino-2-deoxy-alpha-D-glucopyranoside deacetylase [Subtercola sp.]|nr:N-acetyl-D-myo-inositol-2-amino-2-deoxy-alpha-D-glucopyranoside deacetylase [Subtercola sp.]